MSNKFNIEDRVILVGKHIIPTSSWPVWGSKHGCTGTIVDILAYDYTIKWDNGKILCVGSDWLEASNEDIGNPNVVFSKYKRILNEER